MNNKKTSYSFVHVFFFFYNPLDRLNDFDGFPLFSVYHCYFHTFVTAVLYRIFHTIYFINRVFGLLSSFSFYFFSDHRCFIAINCFFMFYPLSLSLPNCFPYRFSFNHPKVHVFVSDFHSFNVLFSFLCKHNVQIRRTVNVGAFRTRLYFHNCDTPTLSDGRVSCARRKAFYFSRSDKGRRLENNTRPVRT